MAAKSPLGPWDGIIAPAASPVRSTPGAVAREPGQLLRLMAVLSISSLVLMLLELAW